jgi:hypothetical protein
MTQERQRCPDVAFIDGSKEYWSTTGHVPFYIQFRQSANLGRVRFSYGISRSCDECQFRVWVMLIVEYPTVTVTCRTAIKALFLYFNLCLSVMLDSLSCSFTSISFLPNCSHFHVCLVEELFILRYLTMLWINIFYIISQCFQWTNILKAYETVQMCNSRHIQRH